MRKGDSDVDKTDKEKHRTSGRKQLRLRHHLRSHLNRRTLHHRLLLSIHLLPLTFRGEGQERS